MPPFVYIFKLVLLGCLIFVYNDGQIEGDHKTKACSAALRSIVIETACLACAFVEWFQRNSTLLQVEFYAFINKNLARLLRNLHDFP